MCRDPVILVALALNAWVMSQSITGELALVQKRHRVILGYLLFLIWGNCSPRRYD